MIDIHSHVLPLVDDGSESMYETRSIIRGLADLGYRHVVATPHWAVGMPNIQSDILAETKQVASSSGIALSLGRECRIHPRLLEHVRHNPELRLNAGTAVLVELPWGPVPEFTLNVFYDLLHAQYRPVLVHPERHDELLGRGTVFDRLVEMGVIIQVNIGSFSGFHGRDARSRAISMLELGKVHIVATDIHTESEVEGSVAGSLQVLSGLVGDRTASILTSENPQALLEGHQLTDLDSSELAYSVDMSALRWASEGTGLLSPLKERVRTLVKSVSR